MIWAVKWGPYFLTAWTFNSNLIRGIHSLKNLQELSGKFGPFCNIREMLEFLNHHFSPLCRYLFCEIYIIERSKEYQINDERNVCPTCQRGAFKRYRGRCWNVVSVPPVLLYHVSDMRNKTSCTMRLGVVVVGDGVELSWSWNEKRRRGGW